MKAMVLFMCQWPVIIIFPTQGTDITYEKKLRISSFYKPAMGLVTPFSGIALLFRAVRASTYI